MSYKPLVSIIIRTKNEERWIGSCLDAIFKQNYTNYEIILVDNCSSDKTVEKAQLRDVKVVTVEEFRPGRAINDGVRASNGEVLVCLSGHCIPTTNEWLEKLVEGLSNFEVAGVYGRQEPLSFSSPMDKRDLLIVFGLDRKVQHKDSFFHNANSALRRDTWNEFPFDEEITNIEDRAWGKEVIAAGKKIIYEPEASVYHYHGIHHDLDQDRASNVARIMEQISGPIYTVSNDLSNLSITAIVPVMGPPIRTRDRTLLEHTIAFIADSRFVKRTVVATDNEETAAIAEKFGALVFGLRPKHLSESFVGIESVLQWALEETEKRYGIQDLIVALQQTNPFRPEGIIDLMIQQCVTKGFDSVIAAQQEDRSFWMEEDGYATSVGDSWLTPREFKDNHFFLGLWGFGCVTHPVFLRDGNPFGGRIGLYDVKDPLASVEIHNSHDMLRVESLLGTFHVELGE